VTLPYGDTIRERCDAHRRELDAHADRLAHLDRKADHAVQQAQDFAGAAVERLARLESEVSTTKKLAWIILAVVLAAGVKTIFMPSSSAQQAHASPAQIALWGNR